MKLFQTIAVSVLFATSCVSAQEIKMETVISGLTNPCGVAIQPGTGDLFVADSGAMRVVRIVDGEIQDVITGFPKDSFGTGAKYGGARYQIGPLGLAFLDQNTLVVGGGGKPKGEDILRVYKISRAGSESIVSDNMEGDAQVLAENKEEKISGEGNFFGVAVFGQSVYTTCRGDYSKGWVAKADIVDGKLLNFTRSIPTRERTNVASPMPITKSPEGFIVVGQAGDPAIPKDSLLTFYDPSGDKLAEWKYKTDLNDISALAYGPERGRLFATDFNWLDPEKGGLFKIIAGEKAGECKTVKLKDLDKPTAMVFDEDGNLFVTVMGTAKDGKPGGSVVMISGLDSDPEKE